MTAITLWLFYASPTIAFVVLSSVIAAAIASGFGGRFGSHFWRVISFAAAIGGFSFVAGFIGPIYITPDSNQGPLFGIFISGPIGAVVGCALGTARSIHLVRHHGTQQA
jgi:hypothetical protein